MRRALLSVGASASAISCAALAGQSRAAQAAGAEEDSSSGPKYGFEGHKVNYGGAGDVKPSNREATKRIVSHMSTVPDEWELFRIATRASLILDKLNEADADIAKRPETLKVKTLEGVDLSRMVNPNPSPSPSPNPNPSRNPSPDPSPNPDPDPDPGSNPWAST